MNRLNIHQLFRAVAFVGCACAWVGVDGAAVQTTPALQCNPDGVAVGGYDVVSYHDAAGPRLGDAGIAVTHDGLIYRFAGESNKTQFLDRIEKFLPAYLGYCAATLSMGRLACPDYTNFKIENGQLFLFELAGFTNGRTMWNSDPVGFKQRADDNYVKLFAPP